MLVTYCPHCGKPNYYIDRKPDDCRGCKETLSAAFVAKSNHSANSKSPGATSFVPYLEEDTDIPDIDALAFEPLDERLLGSASMKFGEVAQQRKTGFKRDNAQKVNADDVKQQFKEDAGNTKRSINVDE